MHRIFCFILLVVSAAGISVSAQLPEFESRMWFLDDGRDVEGVFVSSRTQAGGMTVIVKKSEGTQVEGLLAAQDGHSLRYVAEVMRAKGHEFRDWQFNKPADEPKEHPSTVKGAFLQVLCEDHQFSTASVELLCENYTRRFFRLKDLIASDRELALQLQKANDAAVTPKESVTYPSLYREYRPERDSSMCNFEETDHFIFHWGNYKDSSGRDWFKPGFKEQTFRWFEYVWDSMEKQGAPMPMAPGTAYADRRGKIEVYIAGTGLPKHQEGYAHAAESILMHPSALGPGTGVAPHEFAHAFQFYSGGFRGSPFVGWFWESHANWSRSQFMPDYPAAFEVWLERSHYELNSTRFNYGSSLFLQQITEDPRFGQKFGYEIWAENRKDAADISIEDPLQTIMRLGVERGIWSGDGSEGFADMIGEMTARRVGMDFLAQHPYVRALRNIERNDGAARLRTTLVPTPDRPGYYSPIWSHAPRQYGGNLVELTPDAGSKNVDVMFVGIPSENAGWRATLVAINEAGESRYSRMTKGGRLSIPLLDAKRVVLAIAATPTKYVPDLSQPGYGEKPRFPYMVSVRGAKPSPDPGRKIYVKGDGAPHPNGKGWVAASAKVAPTAYVGPDAMVLDVAKVSDNARIEGHAIVREAAEVSGNAVVGDWAVVCQSAKIGDDARIRGNTRVGSNVSVGGRARVLEYAHIYGDGTIGDESLIRGWGETHTHPKAPLGGGVIVGEDIEGHLGDYGQPINGGMMSGFINGEYLRQRLEDNKHLYARWSFDKANGSLLPDENADCTGLLRGTPEFSVEGSRQVMALNGRDQYVMIEPHVADSHALTFDMMMKPMDAAPNQILFGFEGPDSMLLFTPRDTKNRATLLIRKGNQTQVVSAPAPRLEEWTRATISIGDGAARFFWDGKKVADAPISLIPGDLGFTAGYIGRSSKTGKFFKGKLDDFSVYRRAVSDTSGLSESWKTPTNWIIKGGQWTVDDGVIRQGNSAAQQAILFMPGSENWTDYTIRLQARHLAGPNAFRVHFRATDAEKWWVVDFGLDLKATSIREGTVTYGGPDAFVVPDWSEWQDVLVSVSGTNLTVELNGKEACDAKKPIEPATGGFGIGTLASSAEFRKIKVTSADGKVLYDSELTRQ